MQAKQKIAIALFSLLLGCVSGIDQAYSPISNAVNPIQGAENVPVETDVTASFTEEIDPATVTNDSFTLSDGEITSGVAGFEPYESLVRFNPSDLLGLARTYTATITTSIKSTAGLALSEPIQWSFTTRDGVWGTVEPVANDVDSLSSHPILRSNARGDLLLAWIQRSSGSTSATGTLYARRRLVGHSWESLKWISDNVSMIPDSLEGAIDAAGKPILVWAKSNGTKLEIYGSIFREATNWSDPVRLDASNSGARYPSVAVNAEGEGLAVWTEGIATPYQLKFRRILPTTGWQERKEIIQNPNGPIAVRKMAYGSTTGTLLWKHFSPDGRDARIAFFEPASGWSEPKIPFGDTDTSVIPGDFVVEANGATTVVWTEEKDSNSDINRVWRQTRKPTGVWENPVRVDDIDPGSAVAPKIVSDASGSLVLNWGQHDGVRWNVYSTRRTNGNWSSPTNASLGHTGDTNDFRLFADKVGNVSALWIENLSGTKFEIWGNRFRPSTGWQTAQFLGPKLIELSDSNFDATMDGRGTVTLGWREAKNADTILQSQRFE